MSTEAKTSDSDANIQTEILQQAYEAFNARNINAALALMTADVTWPRAFKGGFVQGHQEIRNYWTEQWSEINPTVTPIRFQHKINSEVIVEVHQIVRDLNGQILANDHVCHLFKFRQELIQGMELCE